MLFCTGDLSSFLAHTRGDRLLFHTALLQITDDGIAAMVSLLQGWYRCSHVLHGLEYLTAASLLKSSSRVLNLAQMKRKLLRLEHRVSCSIGSNQI